MSQKSFFCRFIITIAFIIMTIFAINYLVDPYNYNEKYNLGFDKKEVSYRMNYRIYKILEFKNHPCNDILLGDSRSDSISTEEIKNVSGQEYYNFSYGGGTLQEAIDTFWYAAKITKINNVYMAINFNLFSDNNNMNLVEEAKSIVKSPINYYLNSFILKSSFYNLEYKFFNIDPYSEEPEMNKEAFWEYQLGDKITGYFYSKYKWPDNYIKQLKEIKSYCNENNINFVIWIPPTHVDLQNKVKDYNLQEEYKQYKSTLKSITTVIDFDTVNEITTNKDNYKDPYHFNENVMKLLVKKIWANK
ncbi:MAG: hypothetical protein K0R54_3354 [Clostridiaceae bacterium]|nr:hypothetical protein [Clostridiaceae bacterium]